MSLLPSHAEASQPLRGIVLLLMGITLFPVMDAAAKYLTGELHVVQIVWARYAFHTAVLIVLFGARRMSLAPATRSARLQFARAILLLSATGCFFTALRYIPLADAAAINFVAPLLVVCFSIPFLGEKVGPRRWGAVAVGFTAMLVIIRPGFGEFHWASLLVVVSSSSYALYQIVTRKLSVVDPPLTTLYYSGLLGALLASAAVPFVWTPPDLLQWALLIGIGTGGALSHYLVIRAFAHAPASMLAPFSYTTIVTATVIGYLWFGHFPDAWTIGGAVTIILSGLYVAHREAVSRRLSARADGAG